VRLFPSLAAGFALQAALCALPAPAHAEGGAGRSLVVMIDPGHGGEHPHEGARGPKGLVEKTVALSVAKKLKAMLEAEGATALLTREDDVDLPLAQRAALANEADADIFLSIHCNSMASAADRKVTRGIETYFLSPDPTNAEARLLAEMENGGPDALPLPKSTDAVKGLLADLALGQARNDSAQLAELVQRTLIRTLRSASRGVRQAPFLVLSALKMPAVLVEVGFISHPVEGRKLGKDDYQQKIAEALTGSIKQFAEKVLARRLDAPKSAEVKPAEPQKAPAAPGATLPAASTPAVAGLPAPR
jgi:N-acetylmuramoyl-L-alanine amidase